MAPGSKLNYSITYQTLCQLFPIDGFFIWYCVHFLLRVGSFGCSIFIPLRLLSFLLYSMLCILVRFSLLPSLFIKQIYFFVLLRFMFALFFFVPFRFRFPSKLIPFGGSSTTVRSFCILEFYFLSTPSFSFQNFKLVDNSFPRISKISIAYVFYKPPQSDAIIIINNLRHLAWAGQAFRVYTSLSPRLLS